MKRQSEIELIRQRDVLVARIGMERDDLARRGASLRFSALVVDKIRDGIQHLKKHPEILLLPLAITAVSRPRRLLALGASAIGFWRLLQGWRHRIMS